MTPEILDMLERAGAAAVPFLGYGIWYLLQRIKKLEDELKDERSARQALIDQLLRKAGYS
jgi:hypothetical protein